LQLQIASRAALSGARDGDLDQDLILVERGAEEAEEKVARGNAPGSTGPLGHERRVEREHRRRMIVPRIAMRDVTAHRRRVAHERIGDHGRRVVEYLVSLPNDRRGLESGLASEGADTQ